MPIVKQERRDRWTSVDVATGEDRALSFAARGLLLYLLGKPPDWEVRMTDLIAASPAQEEHVQGLVQELMAAGYVTRTRTHGAGGRWVWHTNVYERPVAAPSGGKPGLGKGRRVGTAPSSGKPRMANPAIYEQLTGVITKEFMIEGANPSKDGGTAHPRPDGANEDTQPLVGAEADRAWRLTLALWRDQRTADYQAVLRHARLLSWSDDVVRLGMPLPGQVARLRGLCKELGQTLAQVAGKPVVWVEVEEAAPRVVDGAPSPWRIATSGR